jgi:hypothetical protein
MSISTNTESVLSQKFIQSYTGSKEYYLATATGETGANGKKKYKYYHAKQFTGGPARTITPESYLAHLKGSIYLTLPPLNELGECKYGAIDIDPYSDGITKDDCKKLVQRICSEKLPLNFVWSESGGLHLYMYASEFIPASLMRNGLAHHRDLLKLDAKVEIFPKQDESGEWAVGNGIKLPCHGALKDNVKFLEQHLIKTEEFSKPMEFFRGFAVEKKFLTESVKDLKEKDKEYSTKDIIKALKNKDEFPGKGGTWDNWITLLIAKLVGVGKTDKEILTQCLKLKHEDHTEEETRSDVQTKLNRAREKFKVNDSDEVRKRFTEQVIYLLDQCKYFDVKKNKLYKPDAIKISWSAKMGVADATTFFKNSRSTIEAEDFIYDPIKYDPNNPLIKQSELLFINKYKPHSLEAIEGDISLFTTLMDHLFTDESAKEFILDYITILIQQPGVKCRFAPIIQSSEFQIGKGSLWRCIKLMLGENAQKVDVKEALDKAKDFLQSRQIVLIDEMKSSGKWEEREEILNEFKLFITEEEQSQRKLFVDYKAITTCTNFMFFTNFKNALTLPENEQRYWVYFCDVPRLNQTFYKDFHKWLDGEGKNYLLYYFRNRTISEGFDPKDVAPKSPNLIDMSKQAQRPLMAELEDRFNEMLPPFQDFRDLIPTTWLMAWCKKNKIKVSRPNDLFPILERLGGVNIGQCEMTKARSGGGTSRHKLTMWVMRNHKKFDGKSNRETGQIWMDDYLSVDDGINLFDDATSNSNYKDRGNH